MLHLNQFPLFLFLFSLAQGPYSSDLRDDVLADDGGEGGGHLLPHRGLLPRDIQRKGQGPPQEELHPQPQGYKIPLYVKKPQGVEKHFLHLIILSKDSQKHQSTALAKIFTNCYTVILKKIT